MGGQAEGQWLTAIEGGLARAPRTDGDGPVHEAVGLGVREDEEEREAEDGVLQRQGKLSWLMVLAMVLVITVLAFIHDVDGLLRHRGRQ